MIRFISLRFTCATVTLRASVRARVRVSVGIRVGVKSASELQARLSFHLEAGEHVPRLLVIE